MTTVAEFFAPTGPLSKTIPNYRPRSGQVKMAEAIEAKLLAGKLESRSELLVEGPTGTGKAQAYIVPLMHWAIHTGKRAVIGTANIALQEQLFWKDLPAAAKANEGQRPLRYALLKGKQNYLCLDKFMKAELKDPGLISEIRPGARETKLGDKSELPFMPSDKVWSEVSVDADSCKGTSCPSKRECFANKARERARNADIVVTNFHLLFTDAKANKQVLPPYQALVLDEAHAAGDIARYFFGGQVREGTADFLTRTAVRLGLDVKDVDAVREESAVFFGKLRAIKASNYNRRFRRAGHVPGDSFYKALTVYADRLGARANRAVSPEDQKDLTNLEYKARSAAGVVLSATQLVSPPGGAVYFLEEDPRTKRLALVARRIDVRDELRKGVYDGLDCVVATSATLTTGDPATPSSYDWSAAELGLAEGGTNASNTLGVESPFDTVAATVMVVPKGLPEPSEKEFPAAAARATLDAALAAGGRTLALFTSYRNLNVAVGEMRAARPSFAVLAQGEGQRTQLIDQFRKDVTSVLMGTDSFWTGVDVPGESLSVVVIDKLPFPSPDDPVLDALDEMTRNASFEKKAFMSYSVPRAVIKFKQGIGRLIRSETDVGAIVVLDKRILTKGYGAKFRRAMSPVGKMYDDVADIAVFLKSKEKAA